MEATETPDCHPANSRATVYTVSPPKHAENVTYTPLNEIMSNTYGIQINTMAKLGVKPVQCTCANCHSLIITRVKQTSGLLVWIVCFILILFGCWFGCFLIPFCIRDLQNMQHFCPNCKKFIGEYHPL